MNIPRRFEAACGLIASFLGLVLLIIIFLGLPFYYWVTVQTISSTGTISSSRGGMVNAFPEGAQILVFVVFGLLLLGLLGKGLGAMLHSRTGANRWRVVLWVSTAAMVIIPAVKPDLRVSDLNISVVTTMNWPPLPVTIKESVRNDFLAK